MTTKKTKASPGADSSKHEEPQSLRDVVPEYEAIEKALGAYDRSDVVRRLGLLLPIEVKLRGGAIVIGSGSIQMELERLPMRGWELRTKGLSVMYDHTGSELLATVFLLLIAQGRYTLPDGAL